MTPEAKARQRVEQRLIGTRNLGQQAGCPADVGGVGRGSDPAAGARYPQ